MRVLKYYQWVSEWVSQIIECRAAASQLKMRMIQKLRKANKLKQLRRPQILSLTSLKIVEYVFEIKDTFQI